MNTPASSSTTLFESELRQKEAERGYPVWLTKLEARLLIGMLTNPAYGQFTDHDEVFEPLLAKLEAVL